MQELSKKFLMLVVDGHVMLMWLLEQYRFSHQLKYSGLPFVCGLFPQGSALLQAIDISSIPAGLPTF